MAMYKNLQRYNFLANHNLCVQMILTLWMYKNLQRYNFLANHNNIFLRQKFLFDV